MYSVTRITLCHRACSPPLPLRLESSKRTGYPVPIKVGTGSSALDCEQDTTEQAFFISAQPASGTGLASFRIDFPNTP